MNKNIKGLKNFIKNIIFLFKILINKRSDIINFIEDTYVKIRFNDKVFLGTNLYYLFLIILKFNKNLILYKCIY